MESLDAGQAALSIFLFFVAGVFEIGGGWLVWKSIRSTFSFWHCIAGCVALVVYGFLPTLQPMDDFGRIYAAYGGFFIIGSMAWGWLFDGFKPDAGDLLGSAIALSGALIVVFWKREEEEER